MITKPIKNYYFQCYGNKQNDIKYFDKYLPMDIDIVVEPFGGSFAVIRNKYYDIRKYNRVINDNDINIYNQYILIRDEKEYLNNVNNELNILDNKELKIELKKYDKNINKLYKTGQFTKTRKNIPNFDNLSILLNKSVIYNDDYEIIYNKYKDNEKAFMFIDPPYLDSFNMQYHMSDDKMHDSTKIYIDSLELLKNAKCKILMVINKNAITEYLFKEFIKDEYEKIYQHYKKHQNHYIISNF